MGAASAIGSWIDSVSLAASPNGGLGTLVATVTQNGPLLPGAGYAAQAQVTVPTTPGQYWVVVTTDVNDSVNKLNGETNNTSISSQPIQVSTYAVSVSAGISVAPAGTVVPLQGRTYNPSTGSAVPNAPATIRILVAGTRRVIPVTSDASGNFTTVFQPLPNEAGSYAVAADLPSGTNDVTQATFILVGMMFTPSTLTQQLTVGVPTTNQVMLGNLGNTALSGITAAVQGSAANLSVKVQAPLTLAASGSVPLTYVIQAQDASVPQSSLQILVRSAECATATLPLNLQVASASASLVATPSSLIAAMLVGAQRTVQLNVSNQGSAATDPLICLLPSVPWLSLATTPQIAPLAPGSNSTILVTLTPATNFALGSYTGTIVVQGSNASLTVPFNFTAVSSKEAALTVTAEDEYTFFAAGTPHPTNATVTISDASTGAVIANGVTGQNGQLIISNIVEGPYNLTVSATNHTTFTTPILLTADQPNNVVAFLSIQSVSYIWTVTPTSVADTYLFTLGTTFLTDVPTPVVTVEPADIDLSQLTNAISYTNFTISNHGLIAVQNVTLSFSSSPSWNIMTLGTNIGNLAAGASVSVPVTFQQLSGTPQIAGVKLSVNGVGLKI